MAIEAGGQFWDWQSEHKVITINDKGGSIHVFKARKDKTTYTVVQKYYLDKKLGKECPGKGCTIPDDLAGEVAQLIEAIDSVREGKGKKK